MADESQKELVAEEFDKKSQSYSQRYSGSSLTSHSFNTRRKRVCELLENANAKKGCKALDIGCGPGVMVQHLAGKGLEVFGVDIAEGMIRQCKESFGSIKNTHFSVGKIENLDFKDSFFDIALSMGVVEYLDDEPAAIKELSRVLKPGAIVIITVPNKLSPYRIWNHVLRKLSRCYKTLCFRRAEKLMFHKEHSEYWYAKLLKANELEVKDVVYYNFQVIPAPFDRMISGLSIRLSEKLERLCRSRLRWLATGFVISAEKVKKQC